EAGFMSVPPARNSRPRLASFFAPAYHALARRKGRRGRRPAGRQDGSPLTPSEPGLAPSPQPNSGVPEFGHDNWSKSETSEVDMGEGWGGGCLFDAADRIPPSRLARTAREPTSPSRGEVTGASRLLAISGKRGNVEALVAVSAAAERLGLRPGMAPA